MTVHGGRGAYVEFSESQIIPNLHSKFGNKIEDTNVPYFYFWMIPDDDTIKVYYQLKTVSYADYKIGMYYVAPDQFKDFKDPLRLF